MKAITADEMKQLEKEAIDIGIPSRILMENAGMKVANIAQNEVRNLQNAVIICGTGGNGGDGLVAARYLNDYGVAVKIFLCGASDKISSNDSKDNLNIINKVGIVPVVITDKTMPDLKAELLKCDLVIDAIYGIGYRKGDMGIAGEAIKLVNSTRKEVKDKRPYQIFSVDVPSGADATTGEVASDTIEADITVTFEAPKIGLLKYPASNFCGKLFTVNIGIPKKLAINSKNTQKKIELGGVQIIDAAIVSSIIPKRKNNTHKGSFGHVLVIAGSSGMMGAAVLAASSAMRTGSGLVTLCVPDEIKDIVNTKSLEIVVAGLSDIKNKIKSCDCIAVGPGLSNSASSKKIVIDLLNNSKINVPIVIDADGLNAISDISIFKKSGKDIVITPHPGEFARLTGKKIDEIQKDRMGYASRFAMDNNVTVVLKGPYTVVAGKNKEILINPTGNPGMASGGTGDVLCGIIAGLVGQGCGTLNSAIAGTYIHGLAADISASIKGEHGLIASDIIESVPFAIKSTM
jgi:ADP-dependent NAD(P)H-hydrate dehydratase / NAD(P)H-hydrate epimerase